MHEPSQERSIALDAFRGAVMLLLIPDVLGGLSMYRVAELYPDSGMASFLARQLTHVQWTGCSPWDLVMPSFLFASGMSIAFSRAARLSDSRNRHDALVHVVLRVAALVLLGMLVQLPVDSYADLAWPLVVLSLGLPWRRWLAAGQFGHAGAAIRRFDSAVWLIVLAAAAAWIATQSHRAHWSFHDILPQLGLAYGFAYLVAGLPHPWRTGVLVAILAGYWLAFALHPLPPADLDLTTVGVRPGDEVFSGLFAHWNKGTNAAAAFDRGFLNLLPRAEPFVFNSHGYQTLNFIPSIVSIAFGVLAGEQLRSTSDRAAAQRSLIRAGVAAVTVGWLAGMTICPVVKSIWTPSWVLFSSGWVLLIFAVFHAVFESPARRRWALPLVVVGASPLLPYVLALYYRPWILGVWQRLLGLEPMTAGWSAVAASALVGFSLWLLAFVMFRLRIAIRL